MASVLLTEDEILKYVLECWEISDKHWETYEKAKWDRSWQLYENKQDYSDKEDWQAKGFIPKTEGNVDTATDLIRRALTSVKAWYGHEGVEEQDKKFAPLTTKIVRWWGDFIKLTTTVVSAVRTSLICSVGILKIYDKTYVKWDGSREMSEGRVGGYSWEPIEAWKPSVDEVDPYDVRFSRDMELYEGRPRGSYIIERKAKEFTDLLLDADKMGYKTSDVRSQDFPKTAEKQKMARDQMKEEATDIRHPIELKEFHGYVRIHPDKKVAGDKQTGSPRHAFDENLKYVVTIANDMNVIRVSGQKDEEYSYPNPNQEYVYRVIRPMPRNFKFYGKSLVDSLANLQVMINDIWNMIFDSVAFEIYKMFGVDASKIEDLDDLKVTPSQMIRTQDDVNRVITQLYVQPMSQNALKVPMAIEAIMDRHSGVTPEVQGISRAGTETATEFAGLMQQSALKFEGLAKTIEEQLSGVIEALTHTVLTTDHPHAWGVAQRILGKNTRIITSLLALSGEYDIKSSGISGYINKIQTQNKLLALLNVLLPVMELGVNIRPIVKGILRANEDVVGDVDEIFPDVPTYDINTIMAVLKQIDPSGQLVMVFQQALQQLQATKGKGGAGGGVRSEAQPSKGGLNETALSPTAWAAGGGPRG